MHVLCIGLIWVLTWPALRAGCRNAAVWRRGAFLDFVRGRRFSPRVTAHLIAHLARRALRLEWVADPGHERHAGARGGGGGRAAARGRAYCWGGLGWAGGWRGRGVGWGDRAAGAGS